MNDSKQINVLDKAGYEACRAAFEGQDIFKDKLVFKRGGSVFAEDVQETDYVDYSIQKQWVEWKKGWGMGMYYQEELTDEKIALRIE